MRSRIDLQTELEALLGSDQVYYQPPTSIQMKYPCIVYERSRGNTKFASDKPYVFHKQYELTYIDKNPDSDMIKTIAMHFPMCVHDRHFASDNLNHDVFSIYY